MNNANATLTSPDRGSPRLMKSKSTNAMLHQNEIKRKLNMFLLEDCKLQQQVEQIDKLTAKVHKTEEDLDAIERELQKEVSRLEQPSPLPVPHKKAKEIFDNADTNK